MAQLEFMEKETIEVMDTEAWIISGENRIEVQIIVTNMRFLAVRENQNNEIKIVCSFDVEELEQIKHHEEAITYYTCYLKDHRFITFDSEPIGLYLSKMV